MEDILQEIATEFHPEFGAACIPFIELIYDYTVYWDQVARSTLSDTEYFIISPPYTPRKYSITMVISSHVSVAQVNHYTQALLQSKKCLDEMPNKLV
jgi:hypothetical protein